MTTLTLEQEQQKRKENEQRIKYYEEKIKKFEIEEEIAYKQLHTRMNDIREAYNNDEITLEKLMTKTDKVVKIFQKKLERINSEIDYYTEEIINIKHFGIYY